MKIDISDEARKDLELHAFCKQMITCKVCDSKEKKEREQIIRDTENRLGELLEIHKQLHYEMSVSFAKRRNAVYKQLVDMELKKDAKKLERYVYHVLEHNGNPDERVLTVTLNF